MCNDISLSTINEYISIMIRMIEKFREMLLSEFQASNNTIISYVTDLKFFNFFLQERKIAPLSVTHSDITDYLVTLNKESSATVRRKISVLKRFYSFLLTERDITENPTLSIKYPKREHKLPNVPSETDIIKMFTGIRELYLNDEFLLLRNNAIFAVLYSTGLRVSELITLKLADVMENEYLRDNSVKRIIKVIGKGNKERNVVLNDIAYATLAQYVHLIITTKKNCNNFGWLFSSEDSPTTHLTRQRIGQIIREVATYMNIDKKLISPHKVRHAFATHILRKGAQIHVLQKILGHSSITSTQIYTSVLNDDLRNMLNDKHPLSKK
ncbi:Tyrosine recombinase XerD [Candidatus Fokinia solitaria]|uniref:Tyrosine recombinase XerD n=1 Tax=Candidatus Fokinia solitaria TaxID=1802984 RepID=A0A2U8BT22_9RICK|nr:tyrosine-type recombinase/integrase [Candidatus Fokinia solitaria]AWD33511.1 Tyrosine recombinase XerD [Candidatus Fokinia solitaria]